MRSKITIRRSPRLHKTSLPKPKAVRRKRRNGVWPNGAANSATGENLLNKRDFYHRTGLPAVKNDFHVDSDDEVDPEWLRKETTGMIDEFSDINEGEKEIMKLWNLHILKYRVHSDCHLPLICEMFIDNNGREIIRKNLYRNFILHMYMLFDLGLISAKTFHKMVLRLQGILSDYPEGQEIISKNYKAQLKYWLKVGMHKQDKNNNPGDKLSSSASAAVRGNTTLAAGRRKNGQKNTKSSF